MNNKKIKTSDDNTKLNNATKTPTLNKVVDGGQHIKLDPKKTKICKNDNISDDNNSSESEELAINKKFECECCKYDTNKPSDWLKHCKSQKHKRMGQHKTHSCPDCVYTCKTAWNMKLHMLTQHSTKETRSNQKYYCSDCDVVFFSSQYYEKHMTGIRHKNFVNALAELQKINNLMEEHHNQITECENKRPKTKVKKQKK